MSTDSKADVFIVESLDLIDEERDHMEGERIQKMLKMSGKRCKYFNIRTKAELREIMKEFEKSEYRYLHLSCHGGTRNGKPGLWTTMDHLTFHDLGQIINPYLDNRRVFVSACEAAKMSLASTLMTTTSCYSVMGPYNDTYFSDAALFWATFYHVMFKINDQSMIKDDIIRVGTETSRLFKQRMKLFTRKGKSIESHILR